jgi:diketogulonate reductase-like aldo/keto reductase
MNFVESNGARIPAIGLGTMMLKEAVCTEAVKTALQLGYRHTDIAERYGNEAAVREGLHEGLAAAGLKRDDVFVTTKVPGNAVLERIGKAHGRSSAQVSLRYLVQQGVVPIPRTDKPDHMAANLAVFDFDLSAAEMAEIGKLKKSDGRVVNPRHAPKWD